jgi:uncharacterized protein YggE
VATIVFGVDITAGDPADAVADAGERMNAAMAAARDCGVDGEDMQTWSYNLWIENLYDPYTYEPTGEKVYHVSHYLSIDVRDVTGVGDVLASVVGAGVNSVSSVNYSIEDISALEAQALDAAVSDARARADSIAAGLGAITGRPLMVSQYAPAYPYDLVSASQNYGYGLSGEFSGIPPVSPGSYTVNSSVSVTFELLQQQP